MKTDNHNPAAKLLLRKYFLDKYHADGDIRVLDCCQASGFLWRELRQSYELASYWGMDVKRKSGRLKIDSARYLALGGWTENVVDIDTYGSPWAHWFSVLENIKHSTTVFLTSGQRVTGIVGSLSKDSLCNLGITFEKIPAGFSSMLGNMVTKYAINKVHYTNGVVIKDAQEVVSGNRNVRYIGVRLEKRQKQCCK